MRPTSQECCAYSGASHLHIHIVSSCMNMQHDKNRPTAQYSTASSVASDGAPPVSPQPDSLSDDEADISARLASARIGGSQPSYCHGDPLVAQLKRDLKKAEQEREREKQEREKETRALLERITQLSAAQNSEKGRAASELTSSVESDGRFAKCLGHCGYVHALSIYLDATNPCIEPVGANVTNV